MKYAAAFFLLSIAVGAYFLVSNWDQSSPAEPTESLPSLAVIERSADDAPRATSQTLVTASTASTVPNAGERELTERLWTAFNSDLATDLDGQAKPVEHDRIVQLIRDNPEIAQALAEEVRQ